MGRWRYDTYHSLRHNKEKGYSNTLFCDGHR
ncbi:MAG: hypothetical protein HDT32_07150 [Clostridiales bacterium]|nr:hypothetical protein [Clostridiales bacterium]